MGLSRSSRNGMGVLRDGAGARACLTTSGGARAGCGVDDELAELEQGELLAVDEQHLLTDRGLAPLLQRGPLGDATEADLAVGVAPGERGERRHEHLAELDALVRRGGAD